MPKPKSSKKKSATSADTLTKKQSMRQWPFPIITVQVPWALLLVKGVKRTENRSFSIPPEWILKPVGIHVSSGFGSRDKLREWFGKRAVASALNEMQPYQRMAKDDRIQEMKRLCGHIIGICYFQPTPVGLSVDPFVDYPEATAYHWYVATYLPFQHPVPGHKGNLRWTFISKQSVMDRFMKELPV